MEIGLAPRNRFGKLGGGQPLLKGTTTQNFKRKIDIT